MVEKLKALSGGDTDMQWAAAIRESASQIWLAGLGAFVTAQREGGKIFDALVKEGELVRERTRRATSERIDELTAQATERWEKLGQIMEDPLGRAFHRFNLPTKKDIDELNRRIDKLSGRGRAAPARAAQAHQGRKPGRPRAS